MVDVFSKKERVAVVAVFSWCVGLALGKVDFIMHLLMCLGGVCECFVMFSVFWCAFVHVCCLCCVVVLFCLLALCSLHVVCCFVLSV